MPNARAPRTALSTLADVPNDAGRIRNIIGKVSSVWPRNNRAYVIAYLHPMGSRTYDFSRTINNVAHWFGSRSGLGEGDKIIFALERASASHPWTLCSCTKITEEEYKRRTQFADDAIQTRYSQQQEVRDGGQ